MDDQRRVVELAQALEHGGRDNVSVIAVQYDGPTAASELASEQSAGADANRLVTTLRDLLQSPMVFGIGAAILVFIIFWIRYQLDKFFNSKGVNKVVKILPFSFINNLR